MNYVMGDRVRLVDLEDCEIYSWLTDYVGRTATIEYVPHGPAKVEEDNRWVIQFDDGMRIWVYEHEIEPYFNPDGDIRFKIGDEVYTKDGKTWGRVINGEPVGSFQKKRYTVQCLDGTTREIYGDQLRAEDRHPDKVVGLFNWHCPELVGGSDDADKLRAFMRSVEALD